MRKPSTNRQRYIAQSSSLDRFLDLLLIIHVVSDKVYRHAQDHVYGDKRKNSKIYRRWMNWRQ